MKPALCQSLARPPYAEKLRLAAEWIAFSRHFKAICSSSTLGPLTTDIASSYDRIIAERGAKVHAELQIR
jgi:hypothetical protein